jgi:LPXTG-site transpeptidase (sortase) family protein
MKRKIAFFVRLVLCGGMLIFTNSGFAVQAQGLSFPAEINKSFTPIATQSGGVSRLNVNIYNPNSFPLSNASWTDNLVGVQPGLSIANLTNVTNSCGGSVTATPGSTTLSLSGGTVPAQVGSTPGQCTVGIDVTATSAGNLINTIPAGALSSTGGGVSVTNTTPASATLIVIGTDSPVVSKSFSPNTVFVGEPGVLTITINNTNSSTSLTQTSLTDDLPAGVVIADPALPANALQNCGASASLVASPGGSSITLNNATVAPSPDCTVRVNVISSVPGVYTNTIPANAITTQQGVTNVSPASASLNVQTVGVEKAFSPTSFQAGDITTLTITLQNPTSSAYTGVNLSDTLPGTVLTVVDGTATTTCGGTVTTTLPRTVTLIGGTIPAGSITNPGTCTISVQVTAPADATAATFTNIIPPDSLVTNQGVTNVLSATAPVTVYEVGTGILSSKSFTPSTIDAGGNSRLRINMRAPADTALTNFTLTDNLPAGVVISNSQGPNVTNCGAGAILTAVTGTSIITLTNGTIEAGVQCRIEVWVTGDIPGEYLNIIRPSDITNDQNRAPSGNRTAILTVLPVSDLSMGKAFNPDSVSPNGVSTLTITLRNNNTSPLVNVTLVDNLPTGLTVATAANASTTCSGGTITAAPGTQTIQLSGGTIPAQAGGVPGVCSINVDVQGSSVPGGYNNTIQAGDVSGTIEATGAAVTPAQNASATLTVQGQLMGLVKGFNPLTVFGGSASTMSVQLINPNGAQITDISFTDNMPTGMFLANPVNFSVGTCGGALSGNPGDGSFSFSGGSLSANSICTLTLSVTTNVNGNLTNTIPAGAVTTANGITNPDPAEATLTNLAGASISKFFSPNPVTPGSYSLLTIAIQNTGNIPLSGLGLRDTLLTGVTIAGPPGPAPVNNCGGTLSAVSGTQDIVLADGNLDASSSCEMVVAVTANALGAYQNTIPVGALTNNENTTNTQPAIDTLTVSSTTPGGGGGGGGSGGGGGAGGNVAGAGGLVGLIPVTGFAPGRVTDLSGIPVTRYNTLSDVTLEIPVLKLKLPVVGIPMKDKTWDVNWLLNQAGWLEGSAFPGFSGNSILTSHATLPYGQAGPFANLYKLKSGDKIFVHSFGDLYVYEVRSVKNLSPADSSILQHEDKSWLTLVTCANYNETAETYLERLTVKAELVHTQPEPWWPE